MVELRSPARARRHQRRPNVRPLTQLASGAARRLASSTSGYIEASPAQPPNLVVRVGTGTDGAKFPSAVAVLQAAAPTVRVPEVLYADTSGRALRYPVMVLRRLRGTPLSRSWPDLDVASRVAALEQVTGELERLHAIAPAAVPGAGFPDPWWASRVALIDGELARHRDAGSFPAGWVERMARHLADHRDALTGAPPPGVLHGDVNWGNALFDGDRLTGLIDLDESHPGPAEEDAWGVLFATELETERWMPLARLRDLPGFDLSAPGVLARYRIFVRSCGDDVVRRSDAVQLWAVARGPEAAQRRLALDQAAVPDGCDERRVPATPRRAVRETGRHRVRVHGAP